MDLDIPIFGSDLISSGANPVMEILAERKSSVAAIRDHFCHSPFHSSG